MLATAVASSFITTFLMADLSFETETARMLVPGKWELSTAGEFQHSAEGSEFSLPFAAEVGLTPRLALLIEPTPYVTIHTKGQKDVHGVGDTEITATFLGFEENGFLPAIAFGSEVKLPTARNSRIGTKATDYAFYAIASKRLGHVDLHANVSYTFIGKPSGAKPANTWSFALAGDYKLTADWDTFAELIYTTSSLGGSSEGSGAATEIGTDELIGTVGIRRHLARDFVAFGSVSYDNAHASLLRAGLTWSF